ncbi:Bacillus transposase protein [Listeria ivanovii subsp. londoniensis]|uniref:LXG domain of WXG superfamily protein n=1 Tax=Listeria ivanovii TaxID=1638 RepID=A0AAX2DSS9_LISIV|nr:EndoU domain-containing protein [Listeria ivanovii]SDX29374.1 LXG domain of WXG superfamily protein [Listeria ivanovii]VEH48167.1 Bacillus transposase protein [Listeria ivanovii subsp. londoniensis]
MSRIDIGELTEFLHNLKKSNEKARTMLKNIQTAAEEYATDTSLKEKAVTTSQTYFQETYPVLCKILIEALNESEDRLEQYIREFGEQVDPSPNSRVDAQLLQEAMDRLAEIKRKQEDLLLRMSAGTGTLYEGQQQSLRTQFTDAIEQENILERYIAFEQSHANFFDSLSELVYQANKAVQEITDHVTFNSQTGTYGLEKLYTTRFEALQELLPKKKKYNFNEYEIRYNGATHILLKNGIVDVEATNAYNEAIKNGELDKVSNQATESAEVIKAVVAALKKGRDPITGQKISKAQSLSMLAGMAFMHVGGRYKGRKLKISDVELRNFKEINSMKKVVAKLNSLKNIEKFKNGSLEHIFAGEVNRKGKAVGFHSETIPDSPGKVIQETKSKPNKNGVYEAKIEVNGIPKKSNKGKSSFFPENWTAQKIVDEINHAFSNKSHIDGNIYLGEASNGIKIQMYLDKQDKIISAFPIYP